MVSDPTDKEKLTLIANGWRFSDEGNWYRTLSTKPYAYTLCIANMQHFQRCLNICQPFMIDARIIEIRKKGKEVLVWIDEKDAVSSLNRDTLKQEKIYGEVLIYFGSENSFNPKYIATEKSLYV